MADITGTTFPFDVDLLTGRIREVYNEDVVKQSIRMILNTYEHERFYYPEFGITLNRFVFEYLDYTTLKQIETEAKESIEKWEKRLSSLEVAATLDKEEYATVILDVSYRIGGMDVEFHYLHTLKAV